jgi:class 3 adenylate cyclase/tetratricopeptide (TPR) repeat protein
VRRRLSVPGDRGEPFLGGLAEEVRVSGSSDLLVGLREHVPSRRQGQGFSSRGPYASVMAVCASCGQENPDGFKFCGSCGASLDRAAAVREERKVVTVLFADLVGFTSRAESMDPEDVRALLAPYHARLRQELERFGGTVEKFIGDAVMALFGAPVAHEDDPERAVRAALAIRDWVREQEAELQLRIAVNTGEALIALGARPEAGEGMASGDVVNTTARLQSAAPVNGILVGEMTQRATNHAIEYRDAAPVAAKGKAEPVPVWEAVQALAAQGVDLLRSVRTPLVGRTRELDALRDALARARAERTTQLVTLVGVPGIGKSRLLYELMQVVEADPDLIRWRQGRSLPYGASASFSPVAEMVKAEAGIIEGDPPAEAAAKLGRVAEAIAEENVEWLTSHLRRVVGAGDDTPAGGDRRSEAFAAWRQFFEDLADQGPLVLVFEDLHWADEGTLDFVEHLVDWATGVPLLIVASARPELLERRPMWGGGKTNALTLALTPLSQEDTARLIAAVAERPLLDANAQQSLLEHAEGNPLYAEQYVRMVLERGDDAVEHELPESVHGIIAARLDGLDAEDKLVLQNGAVVGKVFWRGAAATLGGINTEGVEQRLHALERSEFVQRARRSSVSGEVEYAFRHILVRDVAYGQIPRAARAEKHRAAAAWIRSLGGADDHADMVAHHVTTALDYARASHAETAELELEAREALRLAADRADELDSLNTAVSLYGRLLELVPSGDPDRGEILYRYIRARTDDPGVDDALIDEARADLAIASDRGMAAEAEVTFASLYWLRGDRERSSAAVERALTLVADEAPSSSKAHVLAHAARFAMLAGQNERAIGLSRDALQLAERFDHRATEARAHNIIGCAKVNLGDDEGIEDLEQSLAIAEAANSLEAWQAAGNLASTHFQLGNLAKSDEMRRRTLAIGERFGVVAYVRWQRAEESDLLYRFGRWDEASAIIDDWLVDAEQSAYYMEALVLGLRSRLRIAHDDADGAVADAEAALELAREIRDPQLYQPTSAWRALLAIDVGRPQDAGEPFDALVERRTASIASGYAYGDVDTAWVARALGRGADVEGVFVRHAKANRWARCALHIIRGEFGNAVGVLEQIGSVSDLAYANLKAAQALAAAGRRTESDAHLQRALVFYRSVGATRYIREGESLLAAAS